MIESIKITSLNNIGSNLSFNSIFPVVDTSSPATTYKANLQIIGNAILSGAGGSNFVPALASIYAQSVTNAAQPNITSVGTLSSLAVSGSVNLGYVDDITIYGGYTGQVLATDGTGNLSWTSGIPANVANLVIDNTTYTPDVWLKTVDGATQGIYISPDDGNSELYLGAGSVGTSLTGFSDNGLALLGAGADISLTNIANIRTSRNTHNYTWVFNEQGYMEVPNDGYIGALNSSVLAFSSQNNNPVIIEVIDTANSRARQWTFDNQGNLTLPGNTWQVNYANGSPVPQSGSSIANATSNVTIPVADGNVDVNVNGLTWTFDTDGNLLTPGNIVGPSNANFVIYSNNGAHDFTFADDGTFYAPDNVVLGGTSISIGPGANTLFGLANAVLVASSNSDAYIQGVINNVSDIGSADWVVEGHFGDDDAGWADFGYTSAAFLDANYTITGAGDGYIFAQGYRPGQGPSIGGGNLVLATGEYGDTKDIIFGTGGFLTENIFGRISDSNNALELSRTDSTIKFFDGTILGVNEGANTFGFYNANASTEFLIEMGPTYAWSFNGSDGNLTVPGNIIVDNGVDGNISSDGNINLNATGNVYITSKGHTFNFDSDTVGRLIMPYSGIIASDDATGNGINIFVGNTTTEIGNNWNFGIDGKLTVPGNINLPLVAKLNSGGIGVTNAAEFGTEVTVDGSNVINSSQIYMGAGTAESRAIVNSTGNSLMYTGVENPGFAGTVAVDPGVTSEYAIQVGSNNQIEIGAVVGPITTTGYVAGLGVLNATGNINGIFANATVAVIGAGNEGWKFDTSGTLTLPADGEITTALGTGNVVIEANDGNVRTWTFGDDGSLIFPDATTQVTAYQRTTGSWTIATGSATYSFTVPGNATYTMWVRGNIPNGIIVWNATASVSNSNVPVIGQQFAWNYTGGGTPIEFTAIPTQFIGTANTIVSSNPSVGTTSNQFDFVINNTSGQAQTVYWGYVAQ
jgi:hypothetical protein